MARWAFCIGGFYKTSNTGRTTIQSLRTSTTALWNSLPRPSNLAISAIFIIFDLWGLSSGRWCGSFPCHVLWQERHTNTTVAGLNNPH